MHIFSRQITSALIAFFAAATAPEGAAPALDAAVVEMRHVRPREFDDQQAREKSDRLDAAWKTVIAAKDGGASALLAEVARIDKTAEKDDYFRLGASAILWKIGALDRVNDIVRVWSGVTDFSVNFNYAFDTAFHAALTEDDRAIPLLRALLRDHVGIFPLRAHAMDLEWPATQILLWGLLGPRGLGPLTDVLEKEKDPAAQRTALVILGHMTHAPALEAIRRLAKSGVGEARRAAIQALASTVIRTTTSSSPRGSTTRTPISSGLT